MDICNMLGNRINNLVHKINVLLLSLIIVFAPTYVFANSAIGGWSIGEIAASAGSAIINATKETVINGSSRTIRSFAKVTPTAADLARGIGRFGAVLAVTTAIDALLDGVDWVLDPANNRVIYYPKSQWMAYFGGSAQAPSVFAVSMTKEGACQALADKMGTWTFRQVSGDSCLNTAYNERGKLTEYGDRKEQYLPYNEVGAKIASDAAAGDPAANDFVKNAVAADIADTTDDGKPLAYPSVPSQLDANAGVEPKEGDNDITKETTPNTADPDAPPLEKFKLPGFCSWAAFICDAMGISNANSGKVATNTSRIANEADSIKTATQKTAIEAEATKDQIKAGNTQAHADAEKQLAETTKAATAARELTDFAKQEPTSQEENFDVSKSDLTLPTIDQTRVQFGNQCPAPLTGSYTMLGRTFSINYPWDAACDVAAKFKPAVVGCSTIAAIYIMLGINRTKED